MDPLGSALIGAAALITAVSGGIIGWRKLGRIDKAVNDRPDGGPTISADVAETKEIVLSMSVRQAELIAWQRDHLTHHGELEQRVSANEAGLRAI